MNSYIKTTLMIFFCFAAGITAGALWVPAGVFESLKLETYALYALLFFVGIGMGGDPKIRDLLRKLKLSFLLIPLLIIAGTLLGSALVSLFLPGLSLREALAVGAGFGYYSLSSLIIADLSGETLAAVALIANIFREALTLLSAPWLVKVFGSLAPIASGAATAMDTTLPVIVRFSGKEFVLPALTTGIVLSLLVPFLVSFILKF